ncbi:hypothetical protein [Hymenobacter terrenus]|nr:hypothetical protein [Hymenobacter terrenus]
MLIDVNIQGDPLYVLAGVNWSIESPVSIFGWHKKLPKHQLKTAAELNAK